jgi:hypothetical protein
LLNSFTADQVAIGQLSKYVIGQEIPIPAQKYRGVTLEISK